jgi:hypothetical protein
VIFSCAEHRSSYDCAQPSGLRKIEAPVSCHLHSANVADSTVDESERAICRAQIPQGAPMRLDFVQRQLVRAARKVPLESRAIQAIDPDVYWVRLRM